MFFKVFTWKVGVALHDVHHNGAPSLDVPGLGVVEAHETADDIGAEPVANQYQSNAKTEYSTYGIKAVSVAPRLCRRSSPSSWYMRRRMAM